MTFPLPSPTPIRDLRTVPFARGAPVLGHTLSWIHAPVETPVTLHQRYGDVFRYPIFFQEPVAFAHPDAIGQIFADKDESLSSAEGWRPFFGRPMRGGLLLRDHADHARHRALLRPAFTELALARHVERMNPRIASALDAWASSDRVFAAAAFKRLLLSLAGVALLGVEGGGEQDALIDDFEAVARGVIALVKVPLPGTALRRGLDARERISRFLRDQIQARRATPGPDLFSHLCATTEVDDRPLTEDEIVNHVIFLWMAAHDTTTSGLTMATLELARHPGWQERLRDRARAAPPWLDIGGMKSAIEADWVLSEALRLYPPVSSVPRRTQTETIVGGIRLPPSTPLRAAILLAHRHPEWWTSPERFDPERFGPTRSEHRRHRYLYRPFGAGAHVCLGKRMAQLQMQAVLHQLVRRFRFHLPRDYVLKLVPTPTLRPADRLPLHLERLPS